jgi:hypothetical protein
LVVFFTSNRVSRLIFSGHANGVIEKMRCKFFQRGKCSGVPVIPLNAGPAKSFELKESRKSVEITLANFLTR